MGILSVFMGVQTSTQTKAAPLAEAIPRICTLADISRLLQVSRSQIYLLRREGRFPIRQLPDACGTRPRFSGEDVRRYLSGELLSLRKG